MNNKISLFESRGLADAPMKKNKTHHEYSTTLVKSDLPIINAYVWPLLILIGKLVLHKALNAPVLGAKDLAILTLDLHGSQGRHGRSTP